jgi:hypothetical protein
VIETDIQPCRALLDEHTCRAFLDGQLCLSLFLKTRGSGNFASRFDGNSTLPGTFGRAHLPGISGRATLPLAFPELVGGGPGIWQLDRAWQPVLENLDLFAGVIFFTPSLRSAFTVKVVRADCVRFVLALRFHSEGCKRMMCFSS